MPDFELAAGSVTGRDHIVSGRGSQDAWCTFRGPEALVVVVCDGCGSGRHSEVGAQLGARLLTEALRARVADPAEQLLESTRLGLLSRLRGLAETMGGPLPAVVADYLLFTVIGAIATPQAVTVFSLGDGLVAVNGCVEVLAFPGNEPPYLAYGLLDGDAPRFRIHAMLGAEQLDHLLIGTDGATELIALDALSQFWEQERYFRNPALVTRRLRVFDRETARLHDDATLVAVRRCTSS